MMNFAVLTIFPELFAPFRETGIIRRAVENRIIDIRVEDIRSNTRDRHRTTDDRPYGGGCGMVMKPEPLAETIRSVRDQVPDARMILMTPQGRPFTQEWAAELAGESGLAFICGRYEGIDERICDGFVDEELSVGDFVLTGGEVPAMLVIDAVTRLLPGALGGEASAEEDSFSHGLLEHAHYTRPAIFENEGVPDVLLSGNHRKIEQWRLESSLIRTFLKRPDLLRERRLDRNELEILKKWRSVIEDIIDAQTLHCADSPSRRQ